MTHPRHVFEPVVSSANGWLHKLSTKLELSPDERPRALLALRAGLHTIRDRLPAVEVVDLAAQLPTLIRGLYYEGWSLSNDPTRMRDRAAMIARVHRELGTEKRLNPVAVLRGVIELLVEHVSPGEIRDVVSTLPRGIAALWQEFAGHAVKAAEVTGPAHPKHSNAVRTGFSR